MKKGEANEVERKIGRLNMMIKGVLIIRNTNHRDTIMIQCLTQLLTLLQSSELLLLLHLLRHLLTVIN